MEAYFGRGICIHDLVRDRVDVATSHADSLPWRPLANPGSRVSNTQTGHANA